MNIFAAFAKHDGYLLCLQNTAVLEEGQTQFYPASCQNEALFDHHMIVCTAPVFNQLSPKVGGLESPKLIETSTSEQEAGRINVYIENGSLKIATPL